MKILVVDDEELIRNVIREYLIMEEYTVDEANDGLEAITKAKENDYNLIIKTLTDNVNRTVGEVRAAFNKVHKSLGVNNSVSYNYDYLNVISFKCDSEEDILMSLLDAGIEPIEENYEDGIMTISVNPADQHKLKDVIESLIPNVDYEVDEIGWYAKEEVELNEEDKMLFERLYNLLDDIDDVTDIYHNVANF